MYQQWGRGGRATANQAIEQVRAWYAQSWQVGCRINFQIKLGVARGPLMLLFILQFFFIFFYIIKGFLKSLLCFKPKWFANISANINDGDTNSGIGLMVWNEVNVTSIQFGVGWSWNWIIFKPSVVSNLQDHEAIAEVDRFPFLLSCTCFTFCFDKKKGKKKLNQLGNSFSINKTWRIPLRVFYLFILTQ